LRHVGHHETRFEEAKNKAASKEELWKRIQEEWDAIPITTVNTIIDSMEERRLAVIRAGGLSTGY